MTAPNRLAVQLVGLWLFLVFIALFSRSYIPIDETRYVAVAWNMWLRGDFLVPHLNGETYSHKPPLLFWLMHLGWVLFGVNDWWPRLVPSFFALGSVWLTVCLARRLWPREQEITQLAPIVLMGSLLWTAYTTATMFDMLIAFFTLLGMLGTLIAWQGKPLKGWLLVGLAIGGGLLAKGPTIFLQILPLAILAPWWGRPRQAQGWPRWYLGLFGAIALGALLALAWAVPAGIRGGATYQHEIFWGQTAGRMVQSFDHRRPFWWYLPALPLMLFPWLFWVPFWRGAARLPQAGGELGVRFCLAWLAPVFIAFSFISGKQLHYLLPIFPAFALLAARALTLVNRNSRWDAVPLVVASLVLGGVLLYLPIYAQNPAVAPWLKQIPMWGGLILITAALMLLLPRCRSRLAATWEMTLFSALLMSLLSLTIIHAAGMAYDVRPISAKLKQLEEANAPLAHAGKYPGLFNFLGRLKNSPQITTRATLEAWFERHPDGRAIVYFNHEHPMDGLKPEFVQDLRGDHVAIVNREQWRQWWANHSNSATQADNDNSPD